MNSLVHYKPLLISLGLSEREADLYLASLKLGPTSILAISQATKIHRSLVYNAIDNLIKTGVFRTTLQGKRKLYYGVEPKELVGFLQHKERALRQAIPDLEAQALAGRKKPTIAYFEGREQLQELFRTGLSAKDKNIYAYFPSKYMAELFGQKDMEEIIQERIAQRVYSHTLRSQAGESHFEGDEGDNTLREVRYIPKGEDPRMGFVVFDNKVNLFSPVEENFGIQIESDAYSQLMRYFFDRVWSQSKKTSDK